MSTESRLKHFKMSVKEKKRRRDYNVWYKRWLRIARILKWEKDNPMILMELFDFIDSHHGHGYAHIAQSSLRDLFLVIQECAGINCEDCEKRFECFTEK